jgi:hypothetical protein
MPESIAPPFIVEYLLEKYYETDDPVEEASSFVIFAEEFMDKHRPSTLTNVEGNYVIRLTNGDDVSIAPPVERGGMQQSGRAIPVTGHDTAREILKKGGP